MTVMRRVGPWWFQAFRQQPYVLRAMYGRGFGNEFRHDRKIGLTYASFRVWRYQFQVAYYRNWRWTQELLRAEKR